jgi:hypothetical protein
MSFATLLPLVLALGISFVPVWLLRRPNHGRAQDYFVSSGPTRPEVVRNASIAYALRMAAFGPLFAWGATRDLWPALIGSAFLGLGVYLIYILRRPLLEFLDGALSRDRSITVHEFIARQHGNDPRVRLLAASLTVFALLGLLGGEALAVAALLKPLLPPSAAVCLCVFGALLLTALHAIPSGHSGVMHSAQLQLGMLYLGLLGSTTCSCTCTSPRSRRCHRTARWRSPSSRSAAPACSLTGVRNTSTPPPSRAPGCSAGSGRSSTRACRSWLP